MGDEVHSVIERARRGDRAAFGALVQSYQRRVYLTAFRMTGNHDDANDVAQEAFIRAYRGMAGFDQRADFFTWLYRIVVNVALNFLRSANRRRAVSLDEVRLSREQVQAAGEDPRQQLEAKQTVCDIGAALDELSPALRATVVLVIMEGLPHREVAELLDCSEGTVAWRIHDARQRLRPRLSKYLRERKDAQNPKDDDELPGDTPAAVEVRR